MSRMTNLDVTWSVRLMAEGSSLCHRSQLRAESLLRMPASGSLVVPSHVVATSMRDRL
jgi:hypothetical protein